MNFFGHAVVAGWTGAEAGVVLGSMLPDFESMVKVRVVEVRDNDIQQGVDLHHRTDDAFHRAPTFLSLCAEALAQLTAREWEDRGEAFAKLHERLTIWGPPRDYREPEFVLQRLRDTLRLRPRLAVLEEQGPPLAEFLPTLQSSVERRAPELLNELQDTLDLDH